MVTFLALLFWVFLYLPGRTVTLPRVVLWALDALYAMPGALAALVLLVVSIALGALWMLLTLAAVRRS